MKKQASEPTSRESSNLNHEPVENDTAKVKPLSVPYIPWAWPDDARASLDDRL